ncbi:MAG: ADP-glyceromanno-heptose 6-epimerase [Candidatus Omnitrophica bacterium]|nr:ADP-glyceromanno-heptose 6-epimerase [Candidatus Omnitrophota bacterium]
MIIVTGGAGFIGSAMVWQLNEMGYKDLLVVDNLGSAPGKKKNLEGLKYSDYLHKDEFLKRVEKGKALKGVEGIFHMGACSSTTERDLEYLRHNNFEYTRVLAEKCLAGNVRFIYASSAATYGNGEQGYADSDELIPKLKPLNPYGQSKQDFDLWALENKVQNKMVGLKFFNVFGPNEYHKNDMRSMVHKGWGQVKKTKKLGLFKSYKPEYKDGGQLRDFVYVKDTLKVMQFFWEHPELGGIYNVGTGKAQSWNDLAAALFGALEIPLKIEYIPMPESIRNQYQYYTEADLRKLRSVGCDIEFLPLSDAVADYVKNYLETEKPYL